MIEDTTYSFIVRPEWLIKSGKKGAHEEIGDYLLK